ncbi:MAG: mechanosensitive ion channel family protein [Clostridia bacterium]|nr:mechanosensitive ion channel family protein [Clostridia bacterium]
MEEVKIFFDKIKNIQIVNSIIIVVVSIAIYKGITFFLTKSEKKNKLNLVSGKKRTTYLKLIRSLIRYIFIILTVLILLQINGVDVSSVLAGVGILGVVFGLAIQDWLKDVIRGSSILTDNYFSVGDIVKYKEIEGKVLVIGLKTTKIQDLKTNNILSIANRNIEEVELVSNVIYVNIPMPYELSVEKAEKVIDDIILNVNKNENVEDCKYKGVNELAESYVKYLIEVKNNPLYKLQVKRDTLRTILLVIEKHNIEVPYTQIDIHEK